MITNHMKLFLSTNNSRHICMNRRIHLTSSLLRRHGRQIPSKAKIHHPSSSRKIGLSLPKRSSNIVTTHSSSSSSHFNLIRDFQFVSPMKWPFPLQFLFGSSVFLLVGITYTNGQRKKSERSANIIREQIADKKRKRTAVADADVTTFKRTVHDVDNNGTHSTAMHTLNTIQDNRVTGLCINN